MRIITTTEIMFLMKALLPLMKRLLRLKTRKLISLRKMFLLKRKKHP